MGSGGRANANVGSLRARAFAVADGKLERMFADLIRRGLKGDVAVRVRSRAFGQIANADNHWTALGVDCAHRPLRGFTNHRIEPGRANGWRLVPAHLEHQYA